MDFTFNTMKLHLGCGKRYLKGFEHVDLAKENHIDYLTSIDNLNMFENNSVEEIYCSHAFEYFDRQNAQSVLKEWYRTLLPGGRLYLVVPNFDSLLQIYSLNNNLGDILGPLFGRWNLNDDYIYHKTVWNQKDLYQILESTGFIAVEEFNPITYLANIDEDYDDYSLAFFPHMDKTGIKVSLTLKATKP